MTPEERAHRIVWETMTHTPDEMEGVVAAEIRAAVEERESFLREQLQLAFQKDSDRRLEENRDTVEAIKNLFGFDPETEPFTGVDPLVQARAEAYEDAARIAEALKVDTGTRGHEHPDVGINYRLVEAARQIRARAREVAGQ